MNGQLEIDKDYINILFDIKVPDESMIYKGGNNWFVKTQKSDGDWIESTITSPTMTEIIRSKI